MTSISEMVRQGDDIKKGPLSDEELAHYTREFLSHYDLKDRPLPKRPLAIGIAKSPGVGGTTFGRLLATEGGHTGPLLIQSNSSRVILGERGWGDNVRTLTKAVVKEILSRGHSVIIDGGLRSKKARQVMEDFIVECGHYQPKTYFVGLTCDPTIAQQRAITRYADLKESTFDDWRCTQPQAFQIYLDDIPMLGEELRNDLEHESENLARGVWTIDNSGKLEILERFAGIYWDRLWRIEEDM